MVEMAFDAKPGTVGSDGGTAGERNEAHRDVLDAALEHGLDVIDARWLEFEGAVEPVVVGA